LVLHRLDRLPPAGTDEHPGHRRATGVARWGCWRRMVGRRHPAPMLEASNTSEAQNASRRV